MTQTYFCIERFLGVWVPEPHKYESLNAAEIRIPAKLKRDCNCNKLWRIVKVKVTSVKEYIG